MRCQSLLSVYHFFIIFGSIHFVLQNFGFIFIYICSLTLLVFKIVLRTFLLSFDRPVLTGEQFYRPRQCLNITQKLEVSAYLQKERRAYTTTLSFFAIYARTTFKIEVQ